MNKTNGIILTGIILMIVGLALFLVQEVAKEIQEKRKTRILLLKQLSPKEQIHWRLDNDYFLDMEETNVERTN